MPKRTYKIHVKIKKVLEARGLSQKDLAEMTGIRAAAISEMAQGTRTVINKSHLYKIMDALNITRLDDILELSIEEEF
ncbi:putative XRE family transcriptional regulator 2 [Bacillus phage BSP36]|uniref:XRE family transcriptional regulator 2 n=1 Tax=Bacillus phage BSP38 TaxID=2283013 RepID=A0A345MK65_BPBSP|nr:XRE family transcriptional regulator 2 [Bacillus phage BSP38]AXH71247.1 XRE family transcriptional regulator 2 [Bacillus phage BSP38]AYJ75289.1 putative XRE family transcriptional regulator 2 [Bacillus phage BSP36]